MSGDDIFFENYDNPEPVVGFVTSRVIKAASEDIAIATAKRDILVQWNQSFNADRRLGLPKLAVERLTPIRPWLKPKSQHDYFWFVNPAQKEQQLSELEPKQRSSCWFTLGRDKT